MLRKPQHDRKGKHLSYETTSNYFKYNTSLHPLRNFYPQHTHAFCDDPRGGC